MGWEEKVRVPSPSLYLSLYLSQDPSSHRQQQHSTIRPFTTTQSIHKQRQDARRLLQKHGGTTRLRGDTSAAA